jgi:hypothetical protein
MNAQRAVPPASILINGGASVDLDSAIYSRG